MDRRVERAQAAMHLAGVDYEDGVWIYLAGMNSLTALDYGRTLMALKDTINTLHFIACECPDNAYAKCAQEAIDEIRPDVMKLLGGSINVVPS